MYLGFLNAILYFDGLLIFIAGLILFLYCLNVSQFFHSPPEEHVGCLHVLAIMNNVATTIYVWFLYRPKFLSPSDNSQ